MFVDDDKIVGHGHRSMLVYGAKATGKTTFVVSGGKDVPDSLPAKENIDCSDVVIVQVEAESVLGAVDVGLRPKVIDLSGVGGWQSLNVELTKAIKFLQPLCASGKVRVVGIDLGAIDKEIRAFCAGDRAPPKDQLGSVDASVAAKDVNWGQVTAQGLILYRALRTLPCLVVGMAHVKVSNNNPMMKLMSAEEAKTAELARDVQGFGGDKAKLGPDLATGVLSAWMSNGSHLFARELEVKNVGTPIAPKMQSRYVTHTASNAMFEAGSRRASKLAGVETRTLNAMLKDIYTF